MSGRSRVYPCLCYGVLPAALSCGAPGRCVGSQHVYVHVTSVTLVELGVTVVDHVLKMLQCYVLQLTAIASSLCPTKLICKTSTTPKCTVSDTYNYQINCNKSTFSCMKK